MAFHFTAWGERQHRGQRAKPTSTRNAAASCACYTRGLHGALHQQAPGQGRGFCRALKRALCSLGMSSSPSCRCVQTEGSAPFLPQTNANHHHHHRRGKARLCWESKASRRSLAAECFPRPLLHLSAPPLPADSTGESKKEERKPTAGMRACDSPAPHGLSLPPPCCRSRQDAAVAVSPQLPAVWQRRAAGRGGAGPWHRAEGRTGIPGKPGGTGAGTACSHSSPEEPVWAASLLHVVLGLTGSTRCCGNRGNSPVPLSFSTPRSPLCFIGLTSGCSG